MNSLMKVVLSLSVSGSMLFLVVMAITRLGQNRLSKAWQYYVWLLVAVRLLAPVTTSASVVGPLFAQPSTALLARQTPVYHAPQGPLAAQASAGAEAMSQAAQGAHQALGKGLTDGAQWLWVAWAIGAVLLAVNKGVRYHRFVSWACAAHGAVSDPDMLNRLGRIGEELGIHGAMDLYVNPQVPSPLVVGLWKPRIVLPSAKLSASEFRYVMLHELTHFRRGDQLYKWLMQLILCVHWFNPLVYWMARKVNRACELSCDEAVLRRLDTEAKHEYGSLLIRSLNHPGKHKQALWGNALKGNALAVKERLEAMMRVRKKSRAVTIAGLALSVLLAIGGAGLGAFVPESAMAQSAAGENLRIIQEQDYMTLEGKDIFACTSGELYTLWRNTFDIPAEASMSPIGFEVNAFQDDPVGWRFSMDGALDIMTYAEEADTSKARKELLSTSIRETNYPVVSVHITDTGVTGPFGIEVGMTADTLLSLLPEASKMNLNVDEEGFDTLYTARYQDGNGAAYTLKAYSLLDMISYCVITRE